MDACRRDPKSIYPQRYPHVREFFNSLADVPAVSGRFQSPSVCLPSTGPHSTMGRHELQFEYDPSSFGLESRPWQRLEGKEQQLGTAQRVYVMTGPLFERFMKPMPAAPEMHRVPLGYWKIIALAGGRMVCVYYGSEYGTKCRLLPPPNTPNAYSAAIEADLLPDARESLTSKPRHGVRVRSALSVAPAAQ